MAGSPSGPQPCSRLVRLTLTYRRALGTTRIEGFIVLRKLRLTQAGNGLMRPVNPGDFANLNCPLLKT